MDTAIEVFMSADYGLQCEDYYQVEPVEMVLPRGSTKSWRVQLQPPSDPSPVPASTLLMRTMPVQKAGDSWYRPVAAPQTVSLRDAHRHPCLQLSCSKLLVPYCALDLPADDVLRIRKPFQVTNVGDGHLTASVRTAPPWRVVIRHAGCDANCPAGPGQRPDVTHLDVPPRSVLELCAEVSLRTRDIWPSCGEAYPSQCATTTPLAFFDNSRVKLASMQLVLELDFPVIQVKPSCLDFGYVTDGDVRQDYVEITHSSRTATIELVTTLEGSQDFQIYPHTLNLTPGASERVFVQYTARWSRSPAEGALRARARGGAWCASRVPLRARPTSCALREARCGDYAQRMDRYVAFE